MSKTTLTALALLLVLVAATIHFVTSAESSIQAPAPIDQFRQL